MQEWQQRRRESLAELTLSAHVLAYLIAAVTFIASEPGGHSFNFFSTLLVGLLIPAVIFILLDYHFLQGKYGKWELLAWNVSKHVVLFVMLTIVFASYRSEELWLLSALYLLPAVLATITLGRWWGMGFAAAAAASIFFLSWHAGFAAGNQTFETALVLGGVYFLLAWFLGGIINVEKKTTSLLAAMADKDNLTGLGNHRFFRNRLEQGMEKALTKHEPLSLLLLDIDSFKRYNDICGHLQGDRLLQEFAGVLHEQVPAHAVLTRNSSDDFALILSAADLQAAKETATRLMRAVAAHPFPGLNRHFDKITVSVGVANFPYHGQSAPELLEAASKALYNCKTTGGNRVQSYQAIFERLSRTVGDDEQELANSLRTLITFVNAKDCYTYGHSDRVAYYTRLIGERMGISPPEMRLLEFGAFLHDLGKLEIPREVLHMNGPLSRTEWEMIRKHPAKGAEILESINTLQPIIPMVLHHHENFDGSGYPDGLKGKKIPLFARILRVADSYDAITSNRPYHSLTCKENALQELKRYCGLHYDPMVVNIFLKCMGEQLKPENKTVPLRLVHK